MCYALAQVSLYSILHTIYGLKTRIPESRHRRALKHIGLDHHRVIYIYTYRLVVQLFWRRCSRDPTPHLGPSRLLVRDNIVHNSNNTLAAYYNVPRAHIYSIYKVGKKPLLAPLSFHLLFITHSSLFVYFFFYPPEPSSPPVHARHSLRQPRRRLLSLSLYTRIDETRWFIFRPAPSPARTGAALG